jgi:hypothetical protein
MKTHLTVVIVIKSYEHKNKIAVKKLSNSEKVALASSKNLSKAL